MVVAAFRLFGRALKRDKNYHSDKFKSSSSNFPTSALNFNEETATKKKSIPLTISIREDRGYARFYMYQDSDNYEVAKNFSLRVAYSYGSWFFRTSTVYSIV